MPLYHLFIVYLIGTLIVFLPSFGLAPLFKKAGEAPWKAYIPFYNTWIMQELAGRPKHWVFWQFIPVVGWFISPGIFIEFAKVFSRFSLGHHTAAALFAPLYFPYLAFKEKATYIGAEAARKHKKKAWREWVDAAVFAIVAATLIRTFVFEAYTIPTGSMEKTLLVRDFLFVSKLSYGPRIPNTPLSVPFVHNYMPFGKGKSYSTAIQLPYLRWFPSKVKRGDAVVFNFPEGDTVYHATGFESANPYYDIKRKNAWGPPYNIVMFDNGSEGTVTIRTGEIMNDPVNFPMVVHPVDKTDNYIKRCVAVAGDTLEVKDGDIYIDGVKEKTPPYSLMTYTLNTKPGATDLDGLTENYKLREGEISYVSPNIFRAILAHKTVEKMKADGVVISAVPDLEKPEEIYSDSTRDGKVTFPWNPKIRWTIDYFGKIWIPAKGGVLNLTAENYPVYERAIRVYEKNDFYMKDGKFYLNGKETTQYTFKMDYYWMMGDNRHGSQDSRYWGFVPEDRIVGKAWMIWFSWENGPRWNRLFNIVK